MLILTRRKDYYDYLIGKYGVDRNIVFDRNKNIGNFEINSFPFYLPEDIRDEQYPHILVSQFNYIVVCGKAYLTIIDVNGERILTRDDLKKKKIRNNVSHHRYFWTKHKRKKEINDELIKYYVGAYHIKFIEIHKKIDCPIFRITNISRNGIDLYEKTPVLTNIKGLVNVLPADMIYKELTYFIGNVLRNNPDPEIYSEISNKHKILKGGFDPVTSFRNM